MLSTVLAGFFGALSFVSIIANIRYEKLVRKLKNENETLNEENIVFKLTPLR